MPTTALCSRGTPPNPRANPVRRLVVLGLAAVAGLGVIPAASAATPTDAMISNFSFAPDPVTIPVGGTVKWTNDDNATHTVTADDGSFDSGFKSLHGTFTQTFTKAGSVAYHCNVHAGMHGTVIVGSATTTTTAAPATTTTTLAPTTTTATPTTTTTARATTTTAPTPTTQHPATANGAGPTTAPTIAASIPPKAASPTPPAPTTTQAPAAPSTTTPAFAAPAAASARPGSDEVPPPADATPPAEVASGVTTPGNGDPGGRGGTGPALAAAATLLLGAAGFAIFRYRRLR
jgi:plastocyanin